MKTKLSKRYGKISRQIQFFDGEKYKRIIKYRIDRYNLEYFSVSHTINTYRFHLNFEDAKQSVFVETTNKEEFLKALNWMANNVLEHPRFIVGASYFDVGLSLVESYRAYRKLPKWFPLRLNGHEQNNWKDLTNIEKYDYILNELNHAVNRFSDSKKSLEDVNDLRHVLFNLNFKLKEFCNIKPILDEFEFLNSLNSWLTEWKQNTSRIRESINYFIKIKGLIK